MKIAIYNAQPYDRDFLEQQNAHFHHQLQYVDSHLNTDTLTQSKGAPALCIFVNDPVDRKLLEEMQRTGVKMLALRSAGFNHVDIRAANELGIAVANVPDYSPSAVAEHAAALVLCLVRHVVTSHSRVRVGNYSLNGLMGFDLRGKTVGIIGTGRIGGAFARIMHGLGCNLLGSDPVENPECRALGLRYVPLESLCQQSDIISLHCPLEPSTKHLIDDATIATMRRGVCLVNTSRGAVVDSLAAIRGLKSGQIGYLGMDVYEQEGKLFFEDRSNTILEDDVFARLLTFSNVLVTGHQGYFTREAVSGIARTTLENVKEFESTGRCSNQLFAESSD